MKIDTDTLQVVERARMDNCLGAVRVVPTPLTGTMLVVNCADNGRVLLVEAASVSVKHAIPVGALPIGIAVPDDRFAYVADMADDTISVIDISRGAVVRTIPPATTLMASCSFPIDRCASRIRRTVVASRVSGSNG